MGGGRGKGEGWKGWVVKIWIVLTVPFFLTNLFEFTFFLSVGHDFVKRKRLFSIGSVTPAQGAGLPLTRVA